MSLADIYCDALIVPDGSTSPVSHCPVLTLGQPAQLAAPWYTHNKPSKPPLVCPLYRLSLLCLCRLFSPSPPSTNPFRSIPASQPLRYSCFICAREVDRFLCNARIKFNNSRWVHFWFFLSHAEFTTICSAENVMGWIHPFSPYQLNQPYLLVPLTLAPPPTPIYCPYLLLPARTLLSLLTFHF